MRIRLVSGLPAALAVSLGLACGGAGADEGVLAGVDANVGILNGYGLDVAVPVNGYFGVRLTGDTYSYSRNGTGYGTSVNWNAKLKLGDTGVLADVYPFASAFRFSVGMVHNATKIDATANPSGPITLNGTTYAPGQLGSVSSGVTFRSSAPYAGIGAGNLAGSKGLHFVFDLGAILSGRPTAKMNVTCASTAICPTLQGDAAAEQAKMQNDVDKFKIWPAIRFGVGWAF